MNSYFRHNSIVAAQSASVSPGNPQMMSVAMVIPGTFFSKVSATLKKSATTYSRFIRSNTASLPACTGMCKKA